ncbi:hypothetical protein KIN20_019975 [Parelaphostrongylus tenuis]|uniref:Uncharacterized protein n=1 Tax=Parelaphostrongylus tenuis TaxID=148309 RepID=A0AAD5N3M1_PARTN|nr:hypothetical protein KIN20_019975 [Parelaphostrongylus tenuis]
MAADAADPTTNYAHLLKNSSTPPITMGAKFRRRRRFIPKWVLFDPPPGEMRSSPMYIYSSRTMPT